ncbi:hypothetical protein GO986_12015 [Deinococcus sp. HMF7620]|uniref:Uncharacterized protein n=1 Tax=Deinococcus arboris TaxID=2682977 RepID=A0A7C9HYU8_9DEIO|nr:MULTISPECIES: hypothetical protein [Deinococcus]MBZ9752158.1 hypothetical protein [Deinococcus betulae]MVN87490.1 hypothetical protein [Deinococcus arboris]
MPVLQQDDLTLSYGWDAPLGYYFLIVEQEGKLVYSNLDDPQALAGPYGGGLTLMHLQAKLQGFGVVLDLPELDALAGHTPASSPRAPALTQLLDALNRPAPEATDPEPT